MTLSGPGQSLIANSPPMLLQSFTLSSPSSLRLPRRICLRRWAKISWRGISNSASWCISSIMITCQCEPLCLVVTYVSCIRLERYTLLRLMRSNDTSNSPVISQKNAYFGQSDITRFA